jgi:hypothetical protein
MYITQRKYSIERMPEAFGGGSFHFLCAILDLFNDYCYVTLVLLQLPARAKWRSARMYFLNVRTYTLVALMPSKFIF